MPLPHPSPSRLAVVFLLLALVVVAWPAAARELRGRVVGITDGDTLTLLTDQRQQHRPQWPPDRRRLRGLAQHQRRDGPARRRLGLHALRPTMPPCRPSKRKQAMRGAASGHFPKPSVCRLGNGAPFEGSATEASSTTPRPGTPVWVRLG